LAVSSKTDLKNLKGRPLVEYVDTALKSGIRPSKLATQLKRTVQTLERDLALAGYRWHYQPCTLEPIVPVEIGGGDGEIRTNTADSAVTSQSVD
jgi:hypothetical protein